MRNTEPSTIASATRSNKNSNKSLKSRGISTGSKSFSNNFIFRLNAFLSTDEEGYEKVQLDYKLVEKETKALKVKIEKKIKRRKLSE